MTAFLEALDVDAALDALAVRLDGDLVRPGHPGVGRRPPGLAPLRRPAPGRRRPRRLRRRRHRHRRAPPAPSACASRRRAPATTPRRSAPLDGTILLKTSAMRGVTVDPVRRIARVEAGALWMDVVARRRRARPRRARRLVAGRRRRRLHPRRRPQLARPLARPGRQQRHRASSSSPPTASSAASTPTTTPSCSGRCAAAAAASGSSPRWSSGFPDHRGLRRRSVLPDRARRARCCTPGASWTPTRAGRGDVGRPHPAVPAAAGAAGAAARPVVRRRRGGLPSRRGGRRRELLAPLRALGPALDTFRPTPIAGAGQLHMDPPGPVPGVGDGMLLDGAAGRRRSTPSSRSPARTSGWPLLSVELRHLGGALAPGRLGRRRCHGIDADVRPFAVGITPDPASGLAVRAGCRRRADPMAPWSTRRGATPTSPSGTRRRRASSGRRRTAAAAGEAPLRPDRRHPRESPHPAPAGLRIPPGPARHSLSRGCDERVPSRRIQGRRPACREGGRVGASGHEGCSAVSSWMSRRLTSGERQLIQRRRHALLRDPRALGQVAGVTAASCLAELFLLPGAPQYRGFLAGAIAASLVWADQVQASAGHLVLAHSQEAEAPWPEAPELAPAEFAVARRQRPVRSGARHRPRRRHAAGCARRPDHVVG